MTLNEWFESMEGDESAEDFLMKRRVKGAKSLRKKFQLNKKMLNDVEEPAEWSSVTIDIPLATEEALMGLAEGAAMEAERIFDELSGIAESYAEELEELFGDITDDSDVEDALEAAEDLANDIGDIVKETLYDDSTTVEFSLASKNAASQSNSSAGVAAGVTFGVIGVAAAAGLYATCNRQAKHTHSESLL